jgi:hypothetical protein
MRAAAGWVWLAVGCAGATHKPPDTAGNAEVHAAPATSASPTLVLLSREVAKRFPNLQAVDLVGTKDDANLLEAMRTQTDVTIPIVALEALGLSIDAASRRTGKIRGACWTGDARARTSNAGLGETLDERWHSTVHLLLDARTLSDVLERAAKIDESASARRHPSYWTWESSIVIPIASASLDLVDTTGGRRKPELAAAWRAAWKDIAALPNVAAPPEGAPSGASFASTYVGYLGRLVADDEYERASDRLQQMKSPDAHVVDFRIADLAVTILAMILEQAERPAESGELRALGPIRSLSDLASARTAAKHALAAMSGIDDRTHALCDLVSPPSNELTAGDSEADRWLSAIDAARALDVPKLDGIVRSLLIALARTARL